jgi:hypothetical protein
VLAGTSGQVREAAGVPAGPGRCPGLAVPLARGDGQSVSGGVDDKPEVSWGHCAQIPLSAMRLPSEVAWAIELRVILPARISASPYQDCRSPRSRRLGVATVPGNPSAARPTASRISPRWAAQYRSYFDVTPPVCPHDHGTGSPAEQ